MHGFAKVGPRQPPTETLQQGSLMANPKRGLCFRHYRILGSR
jgi:hypothetical protein